MYRFYVLPYSLCLLFLLSCLMLLIQDNKIEPEPEALIVFMLGQGVTINLYLKMDDMRDPQMWPKHLDHPLVVAWSKEISPASLHYFSGTQAKLKIERSPRSNMNENTVTQFLAADVVIGAKRLSHVSGFNFVRNVSLWLLNVLNVAILELVKWALPSRWSESNRPQLNTGKKVETQSCLSLIWMMLVYACLCLEKRKEGY